MLIATREGRVWSARAIRLFWPIVAIAIVIPFDVMGLLPTDGIDRIHAIRHAAPMIFWPVVSMIVGAIVLNLPLLQQTLHDHRAPTYYYIGGSTFIAAYIVSIGDSSFNPDLRSPMFSFLLLSILTYGFALDLIQLAMLRLRKAH